jgi:hypothetical protein
LPKRAHQTAAPALPNWDSGRESGRRCQRTARPRGTPHPRPAPARCAANHAPSHPTRLTLRPPCRGTFCALNPIGSFNPIGSRAPEPGGNGASERAEAVPNSLSLGPYATVPGVNGVNLISPWCVHGVGRVWDGVQPTVQAWRVCTRLHCFQSGITNLGPRVLCGLMRSRSIPVVGCGSCGLCARPISCFVSHLQLMSESRLVCASFWL